MFKRLVASGLLFGMAAIAPPAEAANCAMRDQVVERLQSTYSEQLTASGLQEVRNSAAVLEIWASPDTGTFTVLLTNPSGITCVMAAGTHFFAVPEKEVASAPAGTPS